MVEDEFLATARAFTAHLHHAEYLRLKNAAKARSEKAVNGIGIERPVDGVTAMRAETRKQKEAKAREKKVRGAVDGIVAPGEGRRPSDGEGEGSDISDLEEGEKHDDPWQGTQLQRFMTKSPKKGLKGLTGLQGVVSHTRAAAGFQKPEKRDGRGVSPTPARGVDGMKGGDREEEEEDDEDTDDLDAPTYTRPRPPTRPNPSLTKPKPSQPVATAAVKHPPKPKPKAKSPRLPQPRAFLDVTPLPKHPPKLPPDPKPVIKQEPVVKYESPNRGEDIRRIRERTEARRRRKERTRMGREGGEVERGLGNDEIPVFLV